MKLRSTTIIAASGLLILGACAQPGMECTELSRTAEGALAGAAVGAAVRGIRDGDSRAAARGAVVGAAVGAVAGNILDRQAAALQESLSNPNIQVINRGTYLQVVMPDGILFATGSAAVSG
ncbi:MAG: glycine zipper domain-containing protein, partial [Paracoccus sp. (in: a-proteobacteria)]|nr:glycine zipper domain-containing protein [Paracoccus sp. (in: a-proteobacteria)]